MNGFRTVEYYDTQEDSQDAKNNNKEDVSYTSFAAFEGFENSCEDWLPRVTPEQAWFEDKDLYEKIVSTCKFKYLECMAACNCVSFVRDHYVGDPVDVEMFKATGWILEQSPGG